MSILITGISGHLGKIIFEKIKRSKRNIVLIYNKKKFKIEQKKFLWIKKNIFDKKKINFKKNNTPKTLLHLAWEGLNIKDYNADIHTKQVNYHLKFIEELVKSGTKNIVVAGTCFEYGSYFGELSENLKTRPITKYGKAKDKLRKKIEKLREKYQFNFTWLRIFYFYGGPNFKNDLWGSFNTASLNGKKFFEINNGKILRDYLHIDDVVNTIWRLALLNKNLGLVNICSNKPISVNNLVKKWAKNSKFNIKIKYGKEKVSNHEKKSYWGSNKKLKLLLK